MAYDGYLLKIKGTTGDYLSDYTFPHEWITAESFKVVKGTQDLDSYRDAKGELHRNALSHTIYKVEFQLRENIRASQFNAIMTQIQGRYTKPAEKKLKIVAYITETGNYTDPIDVYIPDIEVTIKMIENNDLRYNSIRLAFIQY